MVMLELAAMEAQVSFTRTEYTWHVSTRQRFPLVVKSEQYAARLLSLRSQAVPIPCEVEIE